MTTRSPSPRPAPPTRPRRRSTPPGPLSWSPPRAIPRPTPRPATGAGAKPKGSEPKVVQGGGAGSGDRGLDEYVAKVRDQLPGSTVDLRDEEVEAVARQGCASLAAGKTTAALIAETARLAGVSRAEAVDLITLAVDDVCPDQLDRAGEFS
jgi:hypothetical protein